MKILAVLCAALAIAFAVALSAAPDVTEELLASSRSHKWGRFWQGGGGLADLKMPGGLMPTQIPGPADQWAGGKPHGMAVKFSAPPGGYALQLQFYDAHEAAPPKLSIRLNGKHIKDVQLNRGQGMPAPYKRVNAAMTRVVPLDLKQESNLLEVVNTSGSWCAPAKLRLQQGLVFNPAKAGYLLLAKKGYFAALALLLLGALFFWVAGSSGLKNAAFAAIMVTFSSLLAFVILEAVFREYLIRAPQARHLAAREDEHASTEKGKQFSLIDIIKPNPDPEILYTLRPNLDGRFGRHPLKTNSHGMRGPEVKLKKQKGSIRLAGLGDSVMFGWGVPVEESALSQLGQMLEEKYSRPVEVLNFGCPSYNTAVEVTVYKKIVRPYKPDLVVLIFVLNDFSMPSMRFEPVQRLTFGKSYVWEQLRRRVAVFWEDSVYERERLFMSRTHLGPLTDEEKKGLDEWGKELDEHFRGMTGENAAAAYLRQLADMLAEDGVKGVMVFDHHTVVDLPENAARLFAKAGQYGITVIDMLPVYAAWLKERGFNRVRDHLWVQKNDSHPNAERNRLIADAVLKAVEEKGLLKAH